MVKDFKNYMEEVVQRLIDKVINDMDVCKCDICRTDITALALNKLLPKYIASKKGEMYVKLNYLDPQFETDVMSTITQAAEMVNNKKRHE